MTARLFLMAGLGLMILAVLLGAFGAHALKSILSTYQTQIWKTASDYHFYHALGLIALGLWAQRNPLGRLGFMAGICLLLGILIFSGSLYLLAISGISKLGILTPFGGLLFITGWSLWLAQVLRQPKPA